MIALLPQMADVSPLLPADWPTLALMPCVAAPRITPDHATYAAAEVAAGRCMPPRPADGQDVFTVEVATLVASGRTVPRAVGFARAKVATRAGGDAWYRATIMFDWR